MMRSEHAARNCMSSVFAPWSRRLNIGKICAIDVETGAYNVAEDILEACLPLHAKHSGAALWSERIGYDAVYALSGFADLQRTTR
jgi:hypothetical protein